MHLKFRTAMSLPPETAPPSTPACMCMCVCVSSLQLLAKRRRRSKKKKNGCSGSNLRLSEIIDVARGRIVGVEMGVKKKLKAEVLSAIQQLSAKNFV